MKACVTVLFSLLCISLSQALPSFPGAEGWGADNPGGRGGTVVHVTNLRDNGPGTLRTALAGGNRTIVFDTCGVINLVSELYVGGDNITIAGETALGAGITLAGTPVGGLFAEYRNNLIIRFIRLRKNDNASQGDVVRMYYCNNVVIDHVSTAWSADECYDLSGSIDITVQWGIVNETIRGMAWFHNYGSSARFSLHHNLSAHNTLRNPVINSDDVDIRNNVIYDFDLGLHFQPYEPHNIPFPHLVNVVGNFYKKQFTNSSDRPIPILDSAQQRYFIQDNFYKRGTFMTSSQEVVASFPVWGALTAPLPGTPAITTYPVQEAYQKVVSWAGCWPRDSLDRKNVMETITNTGDRTPDFTTSLTAGLTKAARQPDADNDGVPDWFEDSVGTNRSAADNSGDLDGNGYTNIEEYLHYCAARLLNGLPILEGTAVEAAENKPALPALAAPGNPFCGPVTLALGALDRPARLQIVDISGKTVFSAPVAAGKARPLIWNALDRNNRPLAPGIYFARLTAKNRILGRQKLVLTPDSEGILD